MSVCLKKLYDITMDLSNAGGKCWVAVKEQHCNKATLLFTTYTHNMVP